MGLEVLGGKAGGGSRFNFLLVVAIQQAAPHSRRLTAFAP